MYPFQLVDRVVASDRALSRDTVDAVVRLAGLLHSSVSEGPVDVDSLIERMHPSIVALAAGDEDAVAATYIPRLKKLLEIEPLRTTIKARDVFRGQDKIFRSVRFFTDIRPVFTDGDSPAAVASVTAHTMALEYRQDGEDRKVFVALDSDDLQSLRAAIDRAFVKAAVIDEGAVSRVPILKLDSHGE